MVKEMWKQVLRGREIFRDDLLNREKTLQEKTQITFDLTCFPVFKNVRKILEQLHHLFTPDQAHKMVFSEYLLLVLKTPRVLRTT